MAVRIFIGSSHESLPYARALKVSIEKRSEIEAIVWDDADEFRPGGTVIEALSHVGKNYDFAGFVIRADDVLSRGADTQFSTRDNVVFEAGLCVGAMGRRRSFLVVDSTERIAIPSDLHGVLYAPFNSGHSNLKAGMSDAADSLVESMSTLGARTGERPVKWSSRRSAVGVPGRHLEIFRVSDGTLDHRWFDDQRGDGSEPTWNDWVTFSIAPPVKPIDLAATARPDGSVLDLFVLDEEGHVAHIEWTPNERWGEWSIMPGRVRGPLSAASLHPLHAEVYARRWEDWRTITRWLGRMDDGSYGWRPADGWDPPWKGH